MLGLGSAERWIGRSQIAVRIVPRPPAARLPERFTLEALCLTPERLLRSVRGDQRLLSAVRRNER